MVQETLVEESTILTIWALKVGPFFFLFIDCVYLVWPGEKKKKKKEMHLMPVKFWPQLYIYTYANWEKNLYVYR